MSLALDFLAYILATSLLMEVASNGVSSLVVDVNGVSLALIALLWAEVVSNGVSSALVDLNGVSSALKALVWVDVSLNGVSSVVVASDDCFRSWSYWLRRWRLWCG